MSLPQSPMLLSHVGAEKGDFVVSGFKRGTWREQVRRGVHVKNIDTTTNFVYAVHWNGSECLVELLHKRPGSSSTSPVPADIVRKFAESSRFRRNIVEIDGHIFVSGYRPTSIGKEPPSRPCKSICANSTAREFVAAHGDEMATMMQFPGRISSPEEAKEANMDLLLVERVCDQLKAGPESEMSRLIKSHEKVVERSRRQIREADESRKSCAEKCQSALEVLGAHGIHFEKSNLQENERRNHITWQ